MNSRTLVPVIWTRRQRGVVAALVTVFVGVGSYRLLTNPTFVPDPLPERMPRSADLADRIDPNTADADTLAAIPQLGQSRAISIVAYRDKLLAEHPGTIAFKDRRDLLNIRGVGVNMLLQMEPYLIFPNQPTTAASEPTVR